MKKLLVILIILCITASLCADEIIKVDLPQKEAVTLEPYATFNSDMINESSGIIKSRSKENLFWTHNDSGDDARIFPVNRQGELLVPEWADEYPGFMIADAVNIDWEDIAIDNNGNLIIGACGNNGNARKDLALYLVKEPNPANALASRYFKKITFFYPEQDSFPPKKNNFDCEAVFTKDDKIYLLTKNRANDNTTLYRFDSMSQDQRNPLTKLGKFRTMGDVTAADCSPDGKKLAILTYNNIWLFQVDNGDDFFHGKISWLPIKAKQCEAICFDKNKLLITNEQMELFEVPLDSLIEIN
ncbi:MAG: hypothetical protein KGY75_06175 [Candidatus Cloacimonetes bacterium]|nr:hypothetical protein [Candidatus Cloacimonadota bacterium]MBS3767686.1 hypothetical protein [Candidatus Cloacimonadota bacterium]